MTGAAFFLDITDDLCPMTFVRTKLLVERMPLGAEATVRLKGAEPLANVPRSLRELGHSVLTLVPEDEGSSAMPSDSAVWRLRLRKNA